MSTHSENFSKAVDQIEENFDDAHRNLSSAWGDIKQRYEERIEELEQKVEEVEKERDAASCASSDAEALQELIEQRFRDYENKAALARERGEEVYAVAAEVVAAELRATLTAIDGTVR